MSASSVYQERERERETLSVNIVVNFDDKFLILAWQLDKVKNYDRSPPHYLDVLLLVKL